MAGRTRRFCENEYSENEENKNRDQDNIPASKPVCCQRRRRHETPGGRAVAASSHPDFFLFVFNPHKAPTLSRMYRITIWLQARNHKAPLCVLWLRESAAPLNVLKLSDAFPSTPKLSFRAQREIPLCLSRTVFQLTASSSPRSKHAHAVYSTCSLFVPPSFEYKIQP